MHYGEDRAVSAAGLRRTRVLLTTYGVVSAEYSRHVGGGTSVLFEVCAVPRPGLRPHLPLAGVRAAQTEFFRVMLDEAHFVKNRSTLAAKACGALQASRRWVLTGTPVQARRAAAAYPTRPLTKLFLSSFPPAHPPAQNRLGDVFALLQFLRAEPLCFLSHWREHVEHVFAVDPAAGLLALQRELSPLLLRRTKETRDAAGAAIVTLPPCAVETVVLDFDPAERDFYDAIFKRSRTKFSDFQAAGAVMRWVRPGKRRSRGPHRPQYQPLIHRCSNYANILEMLLRLRQACDHPILTFCNKTPGSTGAGTTGGPGASAAPAFHTFSDIDQLLGRFLQADVTPAYEAGQLFEGRAL